MVSPMPGIKVAFPHCSAFLACVPRAFPRATHNFPHMSSLTFLIHLLWDPLGVLLVYNTVYSPSVPSVSSMHFPFLFIGRELTT